MKTEHGQLRITSYNVCYTKLLRVRLEIGPKDIENGQCVLVTRHNREKEVISLDELEAVIARKLDEVRDGLFERAMKNRENRTWTANTLDELIEIAKNNDGFIKSMWCESQECEEKLKEVAGVSSRCMPLEQEVLGEACVCCGKPATKMIYWGKAY